MKSINYSGENWSVAGLRQLRRTAMAHESVPTVIEILPLSIHASLFLFFAGLAIYLQEDHIGLRATILLLIISMGLAYIMISAFPLISPYSTFDTPLSTLVLLPRLHKKKSSPGDHVKAQALAWLLKTSVDGDAIRESIQAIAGLPFTYEVRHALCKDDSVIRAIYIGLCECVDNPAATADKTLLLSYLLAIYHLVPLHCQPSESTLLQRPDSTLDFSPFLDPLNMLGDYKLGIYEYALLAKAGILHVSNRSSKELTELRHTTIPIMASLQGSAQGLLSLVPDSTHTSIR